MFHCLTVGEDEGGGGQEREDGQELGAGDTGMTLSGLAKGLLWWEMGRLGK